MTPTQYRDLMIPLAIMLWLIGVAIIGVAITIHSKLDILLKRTETEGNKKSEPTNELRERLRKYPRPFRVEYFVDHLVVRDGNGSECHRMASEVAAALNMVAEGDE